MADPYEVTNVVAEPAYATVLTGLFAELQSLQAAVGDEPFPAASAGPVTARSGEDGGK